MSLQFDFLFFFLITWLFASVDQRIELWDHDRTLCYWPKPSPCQLVHKVTEEVVVLFLALHLLDRQLKLALHLPHEEIVNHDVVCRLVQFVLYPHQLELSLHVLTVVQSVHCFEQTYEGAFTALVLRSHQVTHSESYQVDVWRHNKKFFERINFLSCFEKVMNEYIYVPKHQWW